MTDTSAVLSFPQAPQDRLRLALRRLQDALDAQAEAVREFRTQIGALRQAATVLDISLGNYQSALTDVKVELVHAKAAVRSLEHTASRMDAAG